MGRAFGHRCRADISALYAVRRANALEQASAYGGRLVGESWLLDVARRCLPIVEAHHPEGFAELEGIAEGAQLSIAEIWAMNALTDLRDVAAFAELGLLPDLPADGEGCSSVVVPGAASADGSPLLGQTWDLGTDNMPFVRVVRRRPQHGPATVALTTVGCLSLIGLNELGVAVGTTNLRAHDARPGAGYLDIIHRALSGNFDEACRTVREAHRAGAHYFYLAGPDGQTRCFECTATRHVEIAPSAEAYVHTNHFLAPELRPLEVEGTPTASTFHRQDRLTQLTRCSDLEVEQLMSFFADDDGDELAINRKDFGGISSNGSVVMAPGRRAFWAVHGPADASPWSRHPLLPSARA